MRIGVTLKRANKKKKTCAGSQHQRCCAGEPGKEPAARRSTDVSGVAVGCIPAGLAAVYQAVAGAGRPAGCGLPDAAGGALHAAVPGAGAGALHPVHLERDHCRLPADKPSEGGCEPLAQPPRLRSQCLP